MYLQTKNYQDFDLVGLEDDVKQHFQGAQLAGKALPGDEVCWTNGHCQLVQRAKYGWLVGTLEMVSKYLYGHTSRGHPIYLFHPMNPGFPRMRVGCSLKTTQQNQLILVEFADWPDTEKLPRANLIRVLGPVGEAGAEKEALRWLYGYPRLTGKDFLFTGPLEATEDRPLVSGQTINIDPPGCKDIDDVVTLEQQADGRWNFTITIADVAAWVPEEGESNRQALTKTQTLYQSGQAILPMLPVTLSEDKASLLPGQERLGISLQAVWDGQTLAIQGFQATRIRNHASYTYDSIYKAESNGAYPVAILRDIASTLQGRPTQDSHEWIEQFMILYNKEVAKILLETHAGLLRTHTAPDQARIQQYEQIHPDLRFLAFTSAIYAPTEPGLTHAAMGDEPYAHASSPLRRYADLHNQRVLKSVLQGHAVEATTPVVARTLNAGDKRHKRHDRDLFFLEQLLNKQVGSRQAILCEIGEKRIKVYVPTWRRLVAVPRRQEENFQPVVGQQVMLEYYAALNKPNWKERFVTRLRLVNA